MDDFILGKYIPGSSPIHKMNPSSKLLLSVFFVVVVLLSNEWRGNLLLLALILMTIKAAQVPLIVLYRGLKPLLFIILLPTFLQLIFSPNGEVIWQCGPLSLTRGGIVNSWLVLFRFSLIIIVSALLTLSTPPMDLAEGLKKVLRPLRLVKMPVNTISLMISIALRFIPTLNDELRMIVKAQKARGMDFKSGNLIQRSKKIVSLLIPLLFSAFNHAQKLSYAMISRGYQGDQRSHYRVYSWHLRDVIIWSIYIVVSTGALWFRK